MKIKKMIDIENTIIQENISNYTVSDVIEYQTSINQLKYVEENIYFDQLSHNTRNEIFELTKYDSYTILTQLIKLFIDIDIIDDITDQEKDTKCFKNYVINYKIDKTNNLLSLKISDHNILLVCKLLTDNNTYRQNLLIRYMKDNQIYAIIDDETRYFKNYNTYNLLKVILKSGFEEDQFFKYDCYDYYYNGNIYSFKYDINNIKYMYINNSKDNHYSCKIKLYQENDYTITEIYNLPDVLDNFYDESELVLRYKLFNHNIFSYVIEERYNQKGILTISQLYNIIISDDKCILNTISQFLNFSDSITSHKIPEEDKSFAERLIQLFDGLKNIINISRSIDYHNIIKDLCLLSSNITNYHDMYKILSHQYDKTIVQNVLKIFLVNKFLSMDNINMEIQKKFKYIQYLCVLLHNYDNTEEYIENMRISDIVNISGEESDITIGDLKNKNKVRDLMLEYFNNIINYITNTFDNANLNELYDKLLLVNNSEQTKINNIIPFLEKLCDYLEEDLTTSYIIDDKNYNNNLVQEDDNTPYIFWDEISQCLSNDILTMYKYRNYVKYDDTFIFNKNGDIHQYITTYGNTQTTTTKEVTSEKGETKSYSKETISRDQYKYMKINDEGKNKITYIGDNKNQNNKYGFDAYKAGVTEDGNPCIIVLRILPDSVVACDKNMTKYRTNKCVVKNIYGVEMDVEYINKQYKYKVNHCINLNNTTPDGICPLCCANQATQVARPCNHNICLECCVKLMKNKDNTICPFCRGNIEKVDYIPDYKQNIENNAKTYDKAYSLVSIKTSLYQVGKYIEIYDFDKNLDSVCCNGIHYHLNIEDCYKWFEYLLIPDELKSDETRILSNDIIINKYQNLDNVIDLLSINEDTDDDTKLLDQNSNIIEYDNSIPNELINVTFDNIELYNMSEHNIRKRNNTTLENEQ